MAAVIPFQVVFMASIDPAVIANSSPVRGGTMVDTGPGVTTITLSDGGVDAAEMIGLITPRLATEASGGIVHTSDAVKVVTMLGVAGAAADIAADVLFLKPL